MLREFFIIILSSLLFIMIWKYRRRIEAMPCFRRNDRTYDSGNRDADLAFCAIKEEIDEELFIMDHPLYCFTAVSPVLIMPIVSSCFGIILLILRKDTDIIQYEKYLILERIPLTAAFCVLFVAAVSAFGSFTQKGTAVYKRYGDLRRLATQIGSGYRTTSIRAVSYDKDTLLFIGRNDGERLRADRIVFARKNGRSTGKVYDVYIPGTVYNDTVSGIYGQIADTDKVDTYLLQSTEAGGSYIILCVDSRYTHGS